MLVHTLLTNPRFDWPVVARYLTATSVLHGLLLTLLLTGAVIVAGYLLGAGLTALRLCDNPVLRAVSAGYVWLVRSVPLLVQLLFWYEIASLYPELSVGIPFGPAFVTVPTAHLFTGLVAAFVALTLDVAAFASEIIRGGILAVPAGQYDAARALGLPRLRTLRRIVLPQAMPVIIPASGNLVIGTLKATSVVSVIAVQDLLYSTQLIYNQNFLVIPLLLVATIWYVLVTTVLSFGQYQVERRYARDGRRAARGLVTIIRANLPFLPATADVS
jgi:polar amino acid transport system permease protein